MSLTEQKIQETKRELLEWLEAPDRKEMDYDKRVNEIKNKLESGGILKAIFRQYDYLNNWYSSNFVYDMLSKGITSFRTDLVKNGYQVLLVSDKLTEIYLNSNPPYLSFDRVGYWLANCVIQKWYMEAEKLIDIVNRGLSTNLKGGLDFKPAAWFILEIMNKGYDRNIDLKQFNYPKNMGVYQRAIDHWDTQDLNIMNNIISELCDYHLENATYGDPNDNLKIQFSNPSWFVYTFEILNWLSIREMKGLDNPSAFNHPLMSIALNKLPKDTFPMPEDELFNKVMHKLNQ